MSRRHSAEKRNIPGDPIYGSVILEKFINKVMMHGKKSVARKIVYSALERFSKKLNLENVLEGFEEALENAKPILEVRSRRVGGATYQVPVEVASDRRNCLAMQWIIKHARNKPGKSMEVGLATELIDCFNKQGATIKKREDTHRMAEANKAFAHYKW
ncbi:30S ribosomal protein S7 [Candidatus Chlamydia corallus]|uniref:30S ribosomal protein S7 n=1 Tax=Candidatus Chlamydia corallus TaxID=2038470 RepID=UPI000C2FA50B|nr:30S ribosomal protein S7 [Candidatus Chlamydia corallus]